MKSSKRILAMLLAMMMLISACAVSVFAAGSKEEGTDGKSTGTTGEYSWNKKSKTATFVAVKKANRATIKTKKISNKLKNGCTVTKIGKKAFNNCKKLTKIKIYCKKAPSVASGAFKGCNKKCVVYATKKMSSAQFAKLKKNLKKAGFKGKVKKASKF